MPRKSKYLIHDPAQIPSVAQIVALAEARDWDTLLHLANAAIYSPKIISRASSSLARLARVLGSCPYQEALVILRPLASQRWYRVREEAVWSLTRIGSGAAAEILLEWDARSQSERVLQKDCLSRLAALAQPPRADLEESIRLAKDASKNWDWGLALTLLETIHPRIDPARGDYWEITLTLAKAYAEGTELTGAKRQRDHDSAGGAEEIRKPVHEFGSRPSDVLQLRSLGR